MNTNLLETKHRELAIVAALVAQGSRGGGRLGPHVNDTFLHPGADVATRELGIFSAYVAMGIVPLQRKWHANGALNNGWSAAPLREVIATLRPYVDAGNAVEASALLDEVLAVRSAP